MPQTTEDTACLEDTFMDFVRSESYVSPTEKRWFAWGKKVEKLLGHDLDGNQATDGYSLDYAHDAFADGMSEAAYVAEVLAAKAALKAA